MKQWKIPIKFVLFIFFLSINIVFCSAQKFEVLDGSKMEIHGSSNVNHFTCIYPTQQIEPIQVDFNPDQLLFKKAETTLPVASSIVDGNASTRTSKFLW